MNPKPVLICDTTPGSRPAELCLAPWPGTQGGTIFDLLRMNLPSLTHDEYLQSFARMSMWRGSMPGTGRDEIFEREGENLSRMLSGHWENVVCLGDRVWNSVVGMKGAAMFSSTVLQGTRYWRFPHPGLRSPHLRAAQPRQAGANLLTTLYSEFNGR